MNELALFAGAGGGILGGLLLGWRTVCAVERDPYAAGVLVSRQNDGILPPFPIWDDVRTFDGRRWRGIVDVVSGGFPCQDISAAGTGAGIDGEQSGLWREMARIVGEVRPRFVFVENSPMLVRRGLARILGDLAALGFDARWTCLSAAECGAPHIRDRLWLLAYRNDMRRRQRQQQPEGGASAGHVADTNGERREKSRGYEEAQETFQRGTPVPDSDGDDGEGLEQESQSGGQERPPGLHNREEILKSWQDWPPESDVDRVVDRLAGRMDRLKAIGNGQVPRVAAAAWEMLRP
ncbi:MAG: DNA cytosine methyltransferase [Betaproteobacteria bacterium]|nr:DNA cytosine methyltransferase [Betaproteobacteria bacterium]